MKNFFLWGFFLSFVAIIPMSAETNACIEYYPSSCCYKGLEVGAEWLYWRAEQSQMEVAFDETEGIVGVVNTTNSSSIFPDFKYSNGYRVYAAYLLNNCWSLEVALTHLPSSPSVLVSHDPNLLDSDFIRFNNQLFPIFTNSTQATNFSSIDFLWDLNMYYLDVYVCRTLCLCRCMTLEPYAGARGFWMRQKMRIDAASPEAGFGPTILAALLKERFCGGGLIGGMYANWRWRCGFSLIGQFGGSLIYSSVRNNSTVYSESISNISIFLRTSEKNKYHKSHPSIDSFIGIQYLHNFRCFSTEAHIGWENHLFFHTNQFSLTRNGNLTMQGLTLGGSIIF